MKHLGNIVNINGAEIEPVDFISFGSPCQDLSIAGYRESLDGERSGLFFEAIRIIKEMRENDRASGRADEHIRPRYVLFENVPGALSSGKDDDGNKDKGRDMQRILEAFVHIKDTESCVPRPLDKKGRIAKWEKSGVINGDDYQIAYRIHDAQYFGVPQRRRRLYVFADLCGHTAADILFSEYYGETDSDCGYASYSVSADGCRREILSFSESMSGHLESCNKTWEGIAGCTQRSIGECGETAVTMQVRCGCDGGQRSTDPEGTECNAVNSSGSNAFLIDRNSL